MRAQDLDRLAHGLFRSKQGPYKQFTQAQIKSFLLGCMAKATLLLAPQSKRGGRVLSVEPEDLTSFAVGEILLKYSAADVPDLPRLRGLAKKAMTNRLISLLRRPELLLSLMETGPDPGEDESISDEDRYGRLSADNDDEVEDDIIEMIAARQKINELERKIALGKANFGPEFGDFIQTLRTDEGSAAMYGVDGFDRKKIHAIRKVQRRSEISDTQLERYIAYLRAGVDKLIADADYQRSQSTKDSRAAAGTAAGAACVSTNLDVSGPATPDPTI